MKYLLSAVLLLLSFTFSEAQERIKCGLPEAHESNLLHRADRPINQTYYQSLSGLFYIHYDTTAVENNDHRPLAGDDNDNGVPDFVEATADIADSTYSVLVNTMGYDIQPPDEDGIYDVYLRDDLNPSWYGVTYWNDNLNNGSSWIVIDNDFSFAEGFYTTGYDAMSVTMSHEFFHAIQFGYSGFTQGNVYFYEMSSTWIEDLIAPEVNDYISLRQNFFSYPEKTIYDTSGYSIALFGHYLALITEGVNDEFDSIILRTIWHNFGSASHHDAFTSIKNILLATWETFFLTSWLDWVTLNLYNNIHAEFYYHEDQGLIGPINTSAIPLHSNAVFPMNTNRDSAEIRSYQIITSNVRLEILLLGDNLRGFVVVVSDAPERNAIYDAELLIETGVLQPGDEVHFVLGNSASDSGVVNGEINLYYTPNPPDNFMATVFQDSIQLNWTQPLLSGNIDEYRIKKEWINPSSMLDTIAIIDQITDTTYIDNDVTGNVLYAYRVAARNSAGWSDYSEFINISPWPNEEDVNSLRFVNVYPNPYLSKRSIPFLVEFDCNKDYANLEVQLINILGQRVYTKNLQFMSKGRHRFEIADLDHLNIPSGIYFLRINVKKGTSIDRKITILK
jgi:hypothetical protein